MADLFQLESGLSESSSPSGLSPASSTISTGDLRRKYDFGDRVSELSIAQDPFFRLVSKIAKKPIWWLIIYLIIPIGYILIAFEVSKFFGKNLVFSIGLIFLPIIFYPLLAFGKAEFIKN